MESKALSDSDKIEPQLHKYRIRLYIVIEYQTVIVKIHNIIQLYIELISNGFTLDITTENILIGF